VTFPGKEEQKQGVASWFTPTRRSPRWLIVIAFAVALGIATPVAALNFIEDPTGMAVAASSLFFLTGFVAFNCSWKTTGITVLSLWIGIGLGLVVGGRGDEWTAWLVFGGSAVAGSLLLSRGVASIRFAAATDPLTGLRNRTGLWEECEHALNICQRLNQPLTLVHIDLDGFKEINDQKGHAEGDRLLRLCAERWTGVVRAGDTLARIGGDEFLLVLPGSNPADARELMETLQAVSPTEFCFGAAALRFDEDVQSCMDRADVELYNSKRHRASGR